MTEPDESEELFLRQARRRLSPTEVDRQRVLTQLLAQLDLPPSASGSPNQIAGSGIRRLGTVAILALGIGGGAGYWLGLHADRDTQPSAVVAARSSSTAAPSAPMPVSVEPVSTSVPDHPSEPRPTPAVRSRASSIAPLASPGAAGSSPLGLDEEVRQLRRVERSIRERNPRLALVLLADLDRMLPAGQLLEERRAAGIMANCQLGADTAVADARAFTARNAGSAYVARVNDICRLTPTSTERILPPSGTDVAR